MLNIVAMTFHFYLARSKVFFVFSYFLFVIFLTCCKNNSESSSLKTELTDLQQRALKISSPMPENAFLEGMNQSEELIQLGKMLFHEPRLSKSGFLSCNSCHNLATFGVDNLPVSIGHGWQKGVFNAPTVLNVAFHKFQFWNGRAETVEEQAGMPILESFEMASTKEHVRDVLRSVPQYEEMFHSAFPDDPDPIVYENVEKAIGAFERTLITISPFNDYLAGDETALDINQKLGLELFLETGCHTCHKGQVLGGEIFARFQTPAERASGNISPGRFEITGREADKHFFKVPSLLNVEHTYPYLHDGSVWDLSQAIVLVAKEMLNKDLTHNEVELLIEFLGSLSGELPDNVMQLPVLPPSTDATPLPDFTL
jgi:cytochrome c peroxidase